MFVSLDCCEPSVSQNTDRKDVINWPVTLIGKTASQPCPYQGSSSGGSLIAKASRKCVWNATVGGLWMPVNMKQCLQRVISLEELANVSILCVITPVFTMLSTSTHPQNLLHLSKDDITS